VQCVMMDGYVQCVIEQYKMQQQQMLIVINISGATLMHSAGAASVGTDGAVPRDGRLRAVRHRAVQDAAADAHREHRRPRRRAQCGHACYRAAPQCVVEQNRMQQQMLIVIDIGDPGAAFSVGAPAIAWDRDLAYGEVTVFEGGMSKLTTANGYGRRRRRRHGRGRIARASFASGTARPMGTVLTANGGDGNQRIRCWRPMGAMTTNGYGRRDATTPTAIQGRHEQAHGGQRIRSTDTALEGGGATNGYGADGQWRRRQPTDTVLTTNGGDGDQWIRSTGRHRLRKAAAHGGDGNQRIRC
jgi:hypothetical protein